MFSPNAIKLVFPVPVGLSNIDEYIISGGYNTFLQKEQTTFLDSTLEKIKEKVIINDENKSYVYALEPIFSIDGELKSFIYVGSAKTKKNLFIRFNAHFKNMRDRTKGKPIKIIFSKGKKTSKSPYFEKCKDHFEKCELMRLVAYIEPVPQGEHRARENELIVACMSKYERKYIINKRVSSPFHKLMDGAQRDALSKQQKGNSHARGNSMLGKGKGRGKSKEQKTKTRKTTRKFYATRMCKITCENGTETRLHFTDSKKELGVTPRHLRQKAALMTFGHPKYDESYKLGPKQKGPQNSAHHKLWSKGIERIEFCGEYGSLKKPFRLKHKDTGEITSYESIADGFKKIKCRDRKPISKKALQKIVNGQIHGDDITYFPYTLLIEDKD